MIEKLFKIGISIFFPSVLVGVVNVVEFRSDIINNCAMVGALAGVVFMYAALMVSMWRPRS